QISNGSRRLTRDRVEAFSELLQLNRQEARYLDQWVAMERVDQSRLPATPQVGTTPPRRPRRPQNQLISNWLNLYVREAARLIGFRPDPFHIQRMLGGIASIQQVTKSLEFLFREG